MDKGKPDFALLLAKGKKDEQSPNEPVDHAADLGMNGEQAEDSAIKDLMAASKSNDVQGFKSALKDFLEACYPQLSESQAEETAEGPSDSESY